MTASSVSAARGLPASVRVRPTEVATAELTEPERFFAPADPANLLRADPSRRMPVEFGSGGLRLAGHLYRPPRVSDDEATAAVALLGPYSSVKEQTVPHYAERLGDAGFTVLTFDPRGYGESEGEPRAHHDPSLIIEDCASAVSYLLTRPDVDPARIGLVGICMGGGYALSTAARDRRVKTVVSIAGGYNPGGTFQRFLGPEGFAAYCRTINELVQIEFETGAIQYVPTIATGLSDEVPVAAMPNAEAYSYYDRTSKEAPTWSPTTTAASLPAYFVYNAIAHAPLVAPTPLLTVHGTTDGQLLPEHAQQAYAAALRVKELVWIETHNHIELYDQDPYVSEAAHCAIDWLSRHLEEDT
jgi:uncharacterized protein